jgi:hypothetical protein
MTRELVQALDVSAALLMIAAALALPIMLAMRLL